MSWLSRWLPLLRFSGSKDYWEKRYRLGGDSGAGSYGEPARYKARVLNRFVAEHGVESVVEFGCGDGHQLGLAEYPDYLGVDVSDTAIELCRERFPDEPTKRFIALTEYRGERADLSLSLDVLFHLVEDEVFHAHLDQLFAAGRRFVVVYSTSTTKPVKSLLHVRHRNVGSIIAQRFPNFELMQPQEVVRTQPAPGDSSLRAEFFMYRTPAARAR